MVLLRFFGWNQMGIVIVEWVSVFDDIFLSFVDRIWFRLFSKNWLMFVEWVSLISKIAMLAEWTFGFLDLWCLISFPVLEDWRVVISGWIPYFTCIYYWLLVKIGLWDIWNFEGRLWVMEEGCNWF
jgi:hypothetical protein